MKKITKIMALLLVAVLVMTGCATEETTVTINSNGSGKVVSVVDIDKEAFDKYAKDEMGYQNPEAYLKSVMQDMFSYELGTSYYEVVTIDGKEYYEMRRMSVITKGSLASDLSFELGNYDKGIYATKDTVYGDIFGVAYYEKEEPYVLSTYEALGIDLKTMLKYKVTFEFPYSIATTNGVIDPANPKKVTFDIDMAKTATTIFATTNKTKTLESVKEIVDKSNTINKTKIKSLKVIKSKKKKASAKLTYKEIKGARYEIEYSTSKKFGYLSTRYKDSKKTTVTLKNLKRGKKYYVRVRTYKKNYAGIFVYSKWVKKTVKVPKLKKK